MKNCPNCHDTHLKTFSVTESGVTTTRNQCANCGHDWTTESKPDQFELSGGLL